MCCLDLPIDSHRGNSCIISARGQAFTLMNTWACRKKICRVFCSTDIDVHLGTPAILKDVTLQYVLEYDRYIVSDILGYERWDALENLPAVPSRAN